LAPLPNCNIRHVKKKRRRIRREFKMMMDLGGYEMKDVMLDLGSDVNILPKKSWDSMGKPNLVWSSIHPVIEIMDEKAPYPILLDIKWNLIMMLY
jgi:hypothetical protein